MKIINKIQSLILLTCMSGALVSCSDFLDKYPLDAMSDEAYFKKDTDLKYYVNGLYGGILRGANSFRWTNLNGANDDYVGANPSGALMQHSNSGLAGNTNLDWNSAYDYIRSVNYFLKNAYRLPSMNKVALHYLGEGYYCRAVKYFELLQYFGGVPYISEVLTTESKELYKERSSRKEIAQKIIADLDSAIVCCDWKGEGQAKDGRINKESALIMKSRVALFEGTWEYYHGRKHTPFEMKDNDGKDFLEEAVKAGKQLMDKHKNTMFKGTKTHEYFEYFNQYSYQDIPGAFFYKVYSRSLGVINKWYRAYVGGINGGLTKDAVDAYVMSDGRPLEVSSVKLDNATLNELCLKKDARLGQTIFYPKLGRFYDIFGPENNAYKCSYPGLIQNQQRYPTPTGYRVWKGNNFDYSEFDNGETDDLILRYEEGLLNYAEAKAVLGQINQEDLDATVNLIRSRVGVPGMVLDEVNSWDITYNKKSGYDPSAPNIVNEIRRERRVEFMLEGLRMMDIKRWAQLDEVFNGWKPVGAYAQEFVDYWNNTTGQLKADGFDWKPFPQVKLVKGQNYDTIGEYLNPFFKNADFKETSGRGYYVDPNRNYLFAIPKEEITLYMDKANVVLEQNPGWF